MWIDIKRFYSLNTILIVKANLYVQLMPICEPTKCVKYVAWMGQIHFICVSWAISSSSFECFVSSTNWNEICRHWAVQYQSKPKVMAFPLIKNSWILRMIFFYIGLKGFFSVFSKYQNYSLRLMKRSISGCMVH